MELLVQQDKDCIEHLKRAEANYYELFNKASVAILILDAEIGIILDVNAMATQITGFSKEEFINKHPYDTLSSLDCSITKASAAENMKLAIQGCPVISDRQYIHKEGHVFWVQVSISKATIDN